MSGSDLTMPMRTKPWPQKQSRARLCPICGTTWRPWAGSFLPCHARCLFQEHAAEAIRSSAASDGKLAAGYGVTPSIIRSIRSPVRRT